jgi:hypothetical protein
MSGRWTLHQRHVGALPGRGEAAWLASCNCWVQQVCSDRPPPLASESPPLLILPGSKSASLLTRRGFGAAPVVIPRRRRNSSGEVGPLGGAALEAAASSGSVVEVDTDPAPPNDPASVCVCALHSTNAVCCRRSLMQSGAGVQGIPARCYDAKQ